MQELTYATVCSGIECMSAAVQPLGGWKPIFFSEIEAFPSAVLAHHYPSVPNLGDMTKIHAEQIGNEEKWRITNGTTAIEIDRRLDVFAGGTPCTDVSVAGKREGMAEGSGTRSSLAFEFSRLVRELKPR